MSAELKLELFEEEADPERLDRVTQQLRQELLELDVDDVSTVPAGPAPPGSKGIELAAIGALIVSMKGSVDLVEKVVSVVRSWLNRGPQQQARTVKVTIDGQTLELDAATAEQQQQLIDEFVRRLPEA